MNRLVRGNTNGFSKTLVVNDHTFGRLSQETGLNVYNVLIKLCIQNARATNNENVYKEELGRTYHLLELMRQSRFQLEEETYRPILEYIIDMGLVERFQVFYHFIKASNPSSITRLGYYEMLLWTKVNNEERLTMFSVILSIQFVNTLLLKRVKTLLLYEVVESVFHVSLSFEFVSFNLFLKIHYAVLAVTLTCENSMDSCIFVHSYMMVFI